MKALVPLAEGFEEIEAVTVIDVLRRAGIDVVTAGLPSTQVRSSGGLRIIADTKLEDVDPNEFDALILPGGDPGYKNLRRSQKILQMIRDFDDKQKMIAAICAAPAVLASAGILNERKATIYPGMEREIPRPREGKLIHDGNIITAQGPGVAMEFALKIVEVLLGKEKANAIRKQLVC